MPLHQKFQVVNPEQLGLWNHLARPQKEEARGHGNTRQSQVIQIDTSKLQEIWDVFISWGLAIELQLKLKLFHLFTSQAVNVSIFVSQQEIGKEGTFQ